MSNLAVRTGNHGKLETMRAMVEEVSGTLGAITLLLDDGLRHDYNPDI
jgi:hypothetical protein